MDLLGELRSLGWYLTEAGLKKVTPPSDKCNNVNEITKLCLDIDFREIAEGALSSRRGETLKGPLVLQVQWIRNLAAPKATERSSAPRLLCLELSDGQGTIKALELERVSSLNLNLPPGTKIRFRAEQLQLLGGYLLLQNQEMQILGGKVTQLIEKWEVAKSMQLYARNGHRASGTMGPPPWVAFGKNLEAVAENQGLTKDRNFKSLQVAVEKEKDNKENEEFNAMRNEAIAEAAKAGTKKVFGGGGQQILDHNIKKILDKGYSKEEARQMLRATNNNLERALFKLKRRQENLFEGSAGVKSAVSAPIRAPVAARDLGSKRGGTKTGDDDASTKPVGNVSLFDFLTDKLPTISDQSRNPATAEQVATSTTTTTSTVYPKNTQRPNTGSEIQRNTNKSSSQSATSVLDAKPTPNSSNNHQQRNHNERHSEGRGGRGSDPRQQSNRNTKMENNGESGRRERIGGSNNSSANYRQNGRGNRNSNDNADDSNRNDRGPRRSGGQHYNQSSESNANSVANTNFGRTRSDHQGNKPNSNRNQHQRPNQYSQQQQQPHQYISTQSNSSTQKSSYGQRIRPHGSSTPASNSATSINSSNTPGPTAMLPNGFAYDPSKIIGFQTKEANEFAMNLLRSQGKSIGADMATPQSQPQPPLQPQPAIQYLPQPVSVSVSVGMPISVAPPITTPMPAPATMPHHFGMAGAMPNDGWNWKVGDLCMAKYWDDGQYYEAEITGISDKTCVVYYVGYGNHEEVIKSDCLPITDAHHRPINNYNLQQAPPPQQGPHCGRTAMRYYVPPHKRNH